MRRILALDGGGIRGVFSLMILIRIEEVFREAMRNPKLVLRDVFDYFAGTSTGAIIATFLAWGYGAADILRLYEQYSSEMFQKARTWDRITRYRYQKEAITEFFQRHFRDTPVGQGGERSLPDLWAPTPAAAPLSALGTEMLREPRNEFGQLKYLLVVMRNASTGSSWPVTNNPAAKYGANHPQNNLTIPIWQLLRASTAAPTYFPPETVLLGAGRHETTRIFIDGGITPYNNPALIALLSATLPGYNLNWESGRDKLHVVSIGTGSDPAELSAEKALAVTKLDFARYLAPAMIASGVLEQDMLCRVLGDCLAGEMIDRELYQMRGPGPHLLAPEEKKFTYVRYNTRLRTRLDAEGNEVLLDPFDLDNLDLIPALKDKGREFATVAVKPGHFFPPFVHDDAVIPRSRFASDPGPPRESL